MQSSPLCKVSEQVAVFSVWSRVCRLNISPVMKDLCPRVQLNTSAFCSGGLYRMEACNDVESAGI